MFRRVVSLLLLPCVLLTQSAAMLGHAHAGMRLPGHDLLPHFHTTAPTNHVHGHHHHGPDGHHHHHAIDTEPGPQPPTPPEPQPDHDSDAVFIAAVDAVVVERSQGADGVVPSFWCLADGAAPFAACWDRPPNLSAACGHPPPHSGHSCPLYVRHLTLLI